MKRVFLFSGSALLAAALVVGAVVWKVQSYRRSILRVEARHVEAYKAAQSVQQVEAFLFWPAYSKTNFDRTAFIAALNRIDTSGCPKSFRLAFRDFADAQARANALTAGDVMVHTWLGFGSMNFKPLSEDFGKEDVAAEAFRKVRREALKWGIDY